MLFEERLGGEERRLMHLVSDRLKMKAKILERCLERITIKVSRENTLMIPKKDSNEP